MGSLSDYAELELLDHVFNAAYSPVATVYVGLSTADPTDDASGLAEPVGNGYARKAITFGAASSRRVTQSGAVTFDQATGDWGTITHWAIFDAATAGNMLAHGALAVSKEIVSGNTPTFATTVVYVEFQAGKISTYLVNALLDLMFRNTAYSAPDTYVALCDATAGDDDTGSTISEPSGGGYARVQVNPNGGSSPTWDLASAGVVDNTHDVEFPAVTGDWGTIVAVAVVDAATAGNLLFYANDLEDQAVSTGDTAKFGAGALDIPMS